MQCQPEAKNVRTIIGNIVLFLVLCIIGFVVASPMEIAIDQTKDAKKNVSQKDSIK